MTELTTNYLRQLHGCFVITKKNARLYYLKGPVCKLTCEIGNRRPF